ncbi:MAG: hypothetical protein ABI579_07605, partial [Candidatus Sumerlaeota bacterium]
MPGDGALSQLRNSHPDETIMAPGADHFQRQVENFCRAVATSDYPEFPGESGSQNCRIYEAAAKSFHSHDTISLPPVNN